MGRPESRRQQRDGTVYLGEHRLSLTRATAVCTQAKTQCAGGGASRGRLHKFF